MHTIDTNVLVRYLTGDHPEQSQAARSFIESRDIFVCTTVFLECEWVMRSVYALPVTEICTALRAFAGLPQVTVENPTLLAEALTRTEDGMDFADALHLGASAHCASLLTFDRKFAQSARGRAPKVESLS